MCDDERGRGELRRAGMAFIIGTFQVGVCAVPEWLVSEGWWRGLCGDECCAMCGDNVGGVDIEQAQRSVEFVVDMKSTLFLSSPLCDKNITSLRGFPHGETVYSACG